MIEESVLTNELIADIIKKQYNIDVIKIEKINKGSANLYSLNNNTYVLKEFQTKYSEEDIKREVLVINHLKKDNIPTPEYIKTVGNNYCFKYYGKVIILQKFIEGYTMLPNTADYDQLLESATYLGKIVASLKTLKTDLPLKDITCSKESIDKGILKHKNLLNKTNNENIKNDILEKIKMLEEIKNQINYSDIKNMSIMNTHGDYSVMQFIYKDNKINAIIDFVSACKTKISWEIIRSYSFIDSKSKEGIIDINNLISYTKEFSKYVKLNKYDIKYMPYLYLVKLLTSTYGYKEYINDNTKIDLLEFGIFRTKLCRYLFDNASDISIKLMEAL